jgi:hypothetical protein
MSDDDDFEEPPDQRALPTFLQNLPGVTATDGMGYRIEALRVYLELQLGDAPFVAAYKHLIVSPYLNPNQAPFSAEFVR